MDGNLPPTSLSIWISINRTGPGCLWAVDTLTRQYCAGKTTRGGCGFLGCDGDGNHASMFHSPVAMRKFSNTDIRQHGSGPLTNGPRIHSRVPSAVIAPDPGPKKENSPVLASAGMLPPGCGTYLSGLWTTIHALHAVSTRDAGMNAAPSWSVGEIYGERAEPWTGESFFWTLLLCGCLVLWAGRTAPRPSAVARTRVNLSSPHTGRPSH